MYWRTVEQLIVALEGHPSSQDGTKPRSLWGLSMFDSMFLGPVCLLSFSHATITMPTLLTHQIATGEEECCIAQGKCDRVSLLPIMLPGGGRTPCTLLVTPMDMSQTLKLSAGKELPYHLIGCLLSAGQEFFIKYEFLIYWSGWCFALKKIAAHNWF